MSGMVDIEEQVEALRLLMEKRLGIRAKTFSQAVRRAGRRLPRPVRRAADQVLASQALTPHPKLQRRVNPTEFDAACRKIRQHLDAVDLVQERRDRRLRLAALIALQLLTVMVLFLVWLWWSGQV